MESPLDFIRGIFNIPRNAERIDVIHSDNSNGTSCSNCDLDVRPFGFTNVLQQFDDQLTKMVHDVFSSIDNGPTIGFNSTSIYNGADGEEGSKSFMLKNGRAVDVDSTDIDGILDGHHQSSVVNSAEESHPFFGGFFNHKPFFSGGSGFFNTHNETPFGKVFSSSSFASKSYSSSLDESGNKIEKESFTQQLSDGSSKRVMVIRKNGVEISREEDIINGPSKASSTSPPLSLLPKSTNDNGLASRTPPLAPPVLPMSGEGEDFKSQIPDQSLNEINDQENKKPLHDVFEKLFK